MNSLKSTCVVLVLAGVLYGVYVTLNTPAPSSQDPAQAHIQPPAIDFGPASEAPALSNSLAPPGATTTNLPLLVTDPGAALAVNNPADAPTANVPATFNAPDLTSSGSPPANEPEVEQPSFNPAGAPPAAQSSSAYTLPNTPASTSTSPATPGATSPALEAYKLKQAWQAVEQHVKDGKLRDALAELSPFANNPHLTSEEHRAVYSWLDALAAKVIYGPDHYLTEPYRVSRNGQSLYDVAATYKVPVQLLQNVNPQSVRDPSVLIRGTELKVSPGPFRAEANLAAGEMTLFVGPLYAGRFAFTIGDEKPLAGTYAVRQKDGARAYIGRDGRQIPAGDAANPYGNCWIDLGQNACLHGSSTSPGTTLGCLSFSPQDAQDLYNILSVSSEVVIRQ